jgi:hypothetical protein
MFRRDYFLFFFSNPGFTDPIPFFRRRAERESTGTINKVEQAYDSSEISVELVAISVGRIGVFGSEVVMINEATSGFKVKLKTGGRARVSRSECRLPFCIHTV